MSKMDRDEYYMRLAHVTAMRGTCDRRQVGAVLVYADRILATGFNGAPRGVPECDEVGHLLVHGHCARSVHAEANALLEAGGASLRALAAQGLAIATTTARPLVTIYTTTSPCPGCMNMIINAHVQRVVYGSRYVSPDHEADRSVYALEAAERLGIRMDFWDVARLG
jgi:dCMP deaminase